MCDGNEEEEEKEVEEEEEEEEEEGKERDVIQMIAREREMRGVWWRKEKRYETTNTPSDRANAMP